MSLAPAKSQARVIMQRMRNGQFCSGVAAQNSSFVLLAVAMLAIGLDVGVARITYGVVLPAFARDLQLSLTAAGLLGTLHLIGYLLGTLASPTLNAKVGALALCRASHFVFACAMLVCGLTSDVTTMAAGRFVAGLAAGFGVFSIFLIVFDATEPEKRSAAGSLVWSGIGVAIVASGSPPARCSTAAHGACPSSCRRSRRSRSRCSFRARHRPREAESRRCVAVTARRTYVRQVDLPRRGVFPFRRGLHLLRDLCRRHAEGNWPLTRGRYLVLGDVWGVLDGRRRPGRGPAVGRLRATHRAQRRARQRRDRLAAYPFFFTVGTASLGLGQLSGPAVGGLLADWFGPSAVGWFAAAIYGAGMLAAAVDGVFGPARRKPAKFTEISECST